MQRKKLELSQSAVEFALVLPLLLLVILGLMEMGRLVFIYTAVLNASREAARYGAATGTNDAGVKQYLDCTGIEDAAIRVGFLANIQRSNITIRYDSGGEPDATIATSTRQCPDTTITGGDRIVVRVVVPFAPIVPLVPLKPINVTSTNARTIIGSVAIKGDVPPPPAPPGTPVISNIVPPSGPTNAPTHVTITGTGFTGGTVTFDGAICTVVNDTQITCDTNASPSSPHAAGPVNVTVTVGSNTSVPGIFTYVDPPSVLGISPSSGPTNAVTHVLINGAGFTGATVTFGGATCAVTDDTLIECDTIASPPHAPGIVTVSITTSGGTITTQFEYLAAPQITSVSPLTALPSGFIPITILGNNFATLQSVTFGGIAGIGCAVSPTAPDTTIGCTVPPYVATNPVDITVTTLGGSVTYSSFTYVTATPTATWLYSPTPTQTATTTITPTPTETNRPTVTPTATETNRPTVTATATATVTATPNCTGSYSLSYSTPVTSEGSTTATISSAVTNNNSATLTIQQIVISWNVGNNDTMSVNTSGLQRNFVTMTGSALPLAHSGNTYTYTFTPTANTYFFLPNSGSTFTLNLNRGSNDHFVSPAPTVTIITKVTGCP
jgi:Flp pilus assembly protein TadG